MIDCEPNDVDLEVGGEGGKLHPYVKVREEDSVYMGLPEDAEGSSMTPAIFGSCTGTDSGSRWSRWIGPTELSPTTSLSGIRAQ
jgi:hypothetical protein